MPIIYVGKTTNYSGKPLWEILGNLKNFGVGRLIKRNRFERYPEPCFMKVLKVEAVAPEENLQVRRVRAYVENIFRGRRYPNVVELHRTSYKDDYRLIPKSEEKALYDRLAAVTVSDKKVPDTVPFPPLLSYMLKEEMANKGLPVVEPKLKLHLQNSRNNFYQVVSKS